MYFFFMKAVLNRELCVGCGLCEENMPEIFKIGEFTAELRTDSVPEALTEKLQNTAEDCPTGAISISEKSGGS